MSPRGYFIAGTDTGAGKTRVTCALLRSLAACGHRAVGMKPVASGADRVQGCLVSDDVAQIAANSSKIATDLRTNTYIFEPPVSPDIAAEMAGISVDIGAIVADFSALGPHADRVLVEGTGGWLCPIGARTTMADVAAALGLPVILVVGLKLGCINHALLTAASIRARGCTFAGWIGNRVDPRYLLPEANLATLTRLLEAPPLAVLPYAPAEVAVPVDIHAPLADLARRL
ncbi:MAG: dethiobiotin synthase [Steroidobacteraceae bacterium]